MKKLFVLFMFSTAVICTKAQEVNFKLKMPLNQPLKSVVTMKMDMEGEQSMIMDMVTKSTIAATKFENQNYTFENITDAIKMDMDAGVMTMSYDSEKPTEDPMAEMLAAQMKPLIGKKITMILDEKGKMIETNTDEIEGSENPYENMGMTATYPDKPVKVGDTWTSEAENKGMKTKLTNKYVAKTADGHVVETAGDLFNEKEEKIGTMKSTYTVDPETFFTKTATVNMEMDAEGQKVKMNMQMDIQK